MPKEIERKFLVISEKYKELGIGIPVKQGYLSLSKKRTVRIRISGDKGFLTVKGKSYGATRQEYEYEIPYQDALEMIENQCKKYLIEKLRYEIRFKNNTWEVDEFSGMNKGLVVAEIELEDEEQDFEKPEWVGEEVTGDPRYFNSGLAKKPFSEWD